MVKRLVLAFLSLLSVGQLALALPVMAQGPIDPQSDPNILLNQTGLGVGQGEPAQRLPIIVGRIIRVALGLLGLIFLILTVYAGFMWMIARGESDKVETAKNTLKNGVIGIIIVLIAYTLTGFIVNAVLKAAAQP
jgi:hypothetical protein